MNYLSIENLSKSFGDRWLFQNITFGIAKGQKVALVGANGTGKTTLLRTISGQVAPDTGEVVLNKEAHPGFLWQVPELDDNKNAKQALFTSDNPIAELLQEYRQIVSNPDADADKMQKILDRMEEKNAWDFESKVEQITSKLGLTDLEQKISSMSGGQKKRLALARLLLSEPDFMILDEPTNHLDLEAIEWLESYLSASNVTLLFVTHDRYFMDNLSDEVLELEQGTIYRHQGNYTYFLEKKAEREAIEQAELSKAQNLYKKELDWMRRQPKARGTKAKYREEAFYETEKKASKNLKKDELQLNMKTTRQGRKVMELHHITKRFGDLEVIKPFTYTFKRKERLGIVGKNGAGKSTFLNILTGKLTPDAGKVVTGDTTHVGYFTQETENLNPEHKVIDEIKKIAEFITLGNGKQVSASKFLEMFLFPPEKQYSFIRKLSGGEKKRLQLMKVLIKNPNFLILDEPTNDLDIDTLNALEAFLENYDGSLIIVTHDRYFMDRLTDHLFIFKGDGLIKDFNGNYTDYTEYVKEQEKNKLPSKKQEKKQTSPSPSNDKQRKASYKEKREYEILETEIAKLEEEKAKLVEKLNSKETDHEKLSEWSEEIGKITSDIEAKTERWMELAELIEE